ncbi:hypothetical protein [Vulgatibacter sp.]|uniref:hypothetical protein n=1 Tax=Vulgatibacter sp. TaxID=1971226 RepID=UPI00356A56A5
MGDERKPEPTVGGPMPAKDEARATRRVHRHAEEQAQVRPRPAGAGESGTEERKGDRR